MSYSGIGKEEAEKVIDSVQKGTGAHVSYMPWLYGNEYIGLEGDFTVHQLERLVELMKRAQA